jgi:hypothetical protein
MTTWRRKSSASPVVVSQKFASAFDCPGTAAGVIGQGFVAALRSLPCSFAGSAAGRIWEGSPDCREACQDYEQIDRHDL